VPPRTPSGQQSAEAGAPGAAVARPGVGRWPSSSAAGAGVAGTAAGATAERGSAGESASAQGELAAPSGGSSRYSARFQFLFGALGALAVCVVALSVALVHRPAAAPGVAWASWAPSASGGDIAQQIAAHVGPEYRMPNGHQLVQVTGGPQAVGGQPVVLALRTSGANPTALPDNGVFYELCGEGPHCSIANGKASLERGLLVRREALELALYTFHYISGTSQVLVTFPPPPPSKSESSSHHAAEKGTFQFTTMTGSSSGQPPSRVLLFRPENVAEELAQPLKVTLQGVTPTVSDMNHSPGAPLVNRLTANLLFDSILIRQQQSSPVLLLESPSVGG
jgi:hypothetical protein